MADGSCLMSEKEYAMMLESEMRMVEKLGIKEYTRTNKTKLCEVVDMVSKVQTAVERRSQRLKKMVDDASTWDKVQKKTIRLKKNLEEASSLKKTLEQVSASKKILEQALDLKKKVEAASNSLEKLGKMLIDDESTYL
ncbi:hypothetical protein HanLR1_Chr12g0438951 [Helianthus annuus]|nr:hypothetical protein HanLR1_Chr12g0438951 [Helianthus annuus]